VYWTNPNWCTYAHIFAFKINKLAAEMFCEKAAISVVEYVDYTQFSTRHDETRQIPNFPADNETESGVNILT